MVTCQDQKLIQCQGQSRAKVKLSHTSNSFLSHTFKNNFLKNLYTDSVTSLSVGDFSSSSTIFTLDEGSRCKKKSMEYWNIFRALITVWTYTTDCSSHRLWRHCSSSQTVKTFSMFLPWKLENSAPTIQVLQDWKGYKQLLYSHGLREGFFHSSSSHLEVVTALDHVLLPQVYCFILNL